jgi:hypothetical protein
MSAILFKTRFFPNLDGTDSTTVLGNTNTSFVHTYQGDDATGDGTKEHPYKSVSKALLTGRQNVVFRGVVNEYFYTNVPVIGDDINQIYIKSNFYSYSQITFRCTVIFDYTNNTGNNIYVSNIIIQNLSDTYTDVFYSFISNNYTILNHDSRGGLRNSTAKNIIDSTPSISTAIESIISNNVSLKGTLTSIYCVFQSSCVFKYNGVNIIQPNFVNDSKANIQLIRNAYLAAGMSQTNVNNLFTIDSFGNETCRIVRQQKDGGTSANIFNRYTQTLTGTIVSAITVNQVLTSIQLNVTDSSQFAATGDIFIPNADGSGFEVFTYTSVTINSSTLITFVGASYTFNVAHAIGAVCTRFGDVLDYNLNPDITNEALYASTTGGYVGCFKAATPVNSASSNTFATPININADGSETATSGTLLVKNADDSLTFATGQSQTWNRLKSTNTITIPVARKFNGLGCISQDGSPFGYYFGKHQNLIDATGLTPANTLVANTWYKACNPIMGTYQGVVYNGTTYLPDYFFFVGASAPTSFTLLNADSGTVVKKVLASPLESIEIQPYDDLNTPSVSFPQFSAPLYGDCKMLFYKAGNTYGKTAGTPVLFGDSQVAAITDKISCYTGTTLATGWAVTNADWEFNQLAADTANYYYDYPVLKYLRLNINAHFSADYDI